MTQTIADALISLRELFSLLAAALFSLGLFLIVLGVWCLVAWAARKLFRNWRLYSPHPLAKRIRTFLRGRREAAKLKAARA